MNLFGIPILGVILPCIRRSRVPVNRDGSIVDTGKRDLSDERGFYYVEPWTFEWLGIGWPLSRAYVYRADTGEIVANPEFDEAGPA